MRAEVEEAKRGDLDLKHIVVGCVHVLIEKMPLALDGVLGALSEANVVTAAEVMHLQFVLLGAYSEVHSADGCPECERLRLNTQHHSHPKHGENSRGW